MDNDLKELERKIHQLDNKLIEQEVTKIILKYGLEFADLFSLGKSPDAEKYARLIVAFCREHIVSK